MYAGLPEEVWIKVLHFVRQPTPKRPVYDSSTWAQEDLARCMAVSTVFNNLTAPILYKRVITHDCLKLVDGYEVPAAHADCESKVKLLSRIEYLDFECVSRPSDVHLTYREILDPEFDGGPASVDWTLGIDAGDRHRGFVDQAWYFYLALQRLHDGLMIAISSDGLTLKKSRRGPRSRDGPLIQPRTLSLFAFGDPNGPSIYGTPLFDPSILMGDPTMHRMVNAISSNISRSLLNCIASRCLQHYCARIAGCTLPFVDPCRVFTFPANNADVVVPSATLVAHVSAFDNTSRPFTCPGKSCAWIIERPFPAHSEILDNADASIPVKAPYRIGMSTAKRFGECMADHLNAIESHGSNVDMERAVVLYNPATDALPTAGANSGHEAKDAKIRAAAERTIRQVVKQKAPSAKFKFDWKHSNEAPVCQACDWH